MAILFYEPKPPTPNQHNSTTPPNVANSAAVNTIFDQVDGIGGQTMPTATLVTSTPSTAIFLTPPPTPPAANSNASIFHNFSTQPSANVFGYEQQAMAWKILAITMCKALKEYHQQTSSSKDAFTNQAVQVLPNGQVQPLWK